jgi:SulP family sulfate permease
MIMAALLYIRRVSHTTTISLVTSDYIESSRAHALQDKSIPPYVAIFRIHGPLLFGVTEKLSVVTDNLDQLPEIIIFRLRNMTAIDATGIKALEEVADVVHASGRSLLLCGAREQPAALMRDAEFHRHVGEDNICLNIVKALERAVELHQQTTAAA